MTVGATTSQLCGRTLEEAFGLENADWCQAEANRSVGLKLKRAPSSPEELAEKLHDRVVGKNFDKTRFALEVLASGPLNGWKVPAYIAEGLAWLEAKWPTSLRRMLPSPPRSRLLSRLQPMLSLSLLTRGRRHEQTN
ncbi:hypothetical protein P4133_14000 [Pseudomonas aeruginosa]|nr:hypothetical protein [Pseudomonas aeruginosa]